MSLQERAEITKRLIAEKGFQWRRRGSRWPDAYRELPCARRERGGRRILADSNDSQLDVAERRCLDL
jgi:hypothetical protein